MNEIIQENNKIHISFSEFVKYKECPHRHLIEKYLLLETPVGEGIFFAGQKHVAIGIVASYTEDQIITTSPEEVLKIKEAKKYAQERA